MKLIGAGLPRTATTSQKIALEMLGLGPCYHMVTVLTDLGLVPVWRRALSGEAAWEEIFDGFQATVDWPGAFYYRELMEAYPDARVLLSVRDADGWERSMRETIWAILYGDSLAHDLSAARERVDPLWRQYVELMKEMWERAGLLSPHGNHQPLGSAMLDYNREVQQTVPADRLVVWSPVDGWGPLCELLGVPLPDAPFPRVNDTEGFNQQLIDGCLRVLTEWRAATPAR
jgi:hypothetical protein